MNCSPKRIGSLFSLGPVSPDALPRLLHYVRHHASSRMSADRQRQIIEAWIGLCSESPDGIVDRDTLCEHIDITRPGLIHHLNALERLDMVSRSQRRPDAKRRRVVCYELRMPGKVVRVPEIPDLFDSPLVGIGDADTARREEHDALQVLFRRSDSVTCAPADLEKTTFKGERLTVFTLAPSAERRPPSAHREDDTDLARVALVCRDRPGVGRASDPERTRSAPVRRGVDPGARSTSAPGGGCPVTTSVRDVASHNLPADGICESHRQ